MSRFRVLCGFVAMLAVLAPAMSSAQIQAPPPPPAQAPPPPNQAPPPAGGSVYWNAIATATWNAPDGTAMVAGGYSGAQPSGQAAVASATQQCQGAGGQGCQPHGPWNSGCVYVILGQNATGVAWWSNDTPQAVTQACQQAGYQCNAPIGGCVNQ
jgi:hypothetical protein